MTPNFVSLEHNYTEVGIWETAGLWITAARQKCKHFIRFSMKMLQKASVGVSESCMAMLLCCKPPFRKKAATKWITTKPKLCGEYACEQSSAPFLVGLRGHVSHDQCSETSMTLQRDLQRIADVNMLNRGSTLVTEVVFLKSHTITYKCYLPFNYMSLGKIKDAVVWRRPQSQLPIARWTNAVHQFWWWGVLVFCTEVITSYFCNWTYSDLEK